MLKLQKQIQTDGTIIETTDDIFSVKLTYIEMVEMIKNHINTDKYKILEYPDIKNMFRIVSENSNFSKLIRLLPMNGGGSLANKKMDIPFCNLKFLQLLNSNEDVELWGLYFTHPTNESNDRKVLICRTTKEEILKASTYSKWLSNMTLKCNSSSSWFKFENLVNSIVNNEIYSKNEIIKIIPLNKIEQLLDYIMVSKTEQDFLNAINISMQRAIANSKAGNRVVPIHSFISNYLQSILPDNYSCHAITEESKSEDKVKGLYSSFKMDVSVKRNNEIVGCVSLKMIASNYAQNNKNYLRNLHGETLNIQRVGISNYCLNILPIAVPYLRKNGTIKKLEKISNTHIEPFVIMDSMSSTNFLEIPKVSCIYVVDLNTDAYIEENIDKNLRTGECYNSFIQILNPTKANINTINNLQSEIKDFLNRNSNLNNFFLNIVEDLKNRFPNDFSRNTTLCA